MYASKKAKITCCSELRKWSPKTPFSGGVSCWHLPYQNSICPQRTLKCTLKMKITCCSELWKWSPKTPFSGGVSCWHLPYQKSICPQKTLKCTLKMKITCCSELWKWSPKTTDSGGAHAFLIWEMPATDPSGEPKNLEFYKKIKKYFMCFPSVVFLLFWQNFLEFLIFWRYSRQDLVAF